MKSLIWLRRLLFVVLWLAAVFIAARLTTMPVRADEIVTGCPKCVHIAHNPPSIADPSKTRVTTPEDAKKRCFEYDDIPPSHCGFVDYAYYEYFNSEGDPVSDEYEISCNYANIQKQECAFITPTPTPTPPGN